MLKENIKRLRKARGMTQEDLAVQLHVVRQTVSKWEKGYSVPDAELLIALAEVLDAPVAELLGETVVLPEDGNMLHELSERLAAINALLARSVERKRKALAFCSCAGVAAVLVLLLRDAVMLSRLRAFPQNAAISTVGGANGPVEVLVTASPAPAKAVLAALVLILSLLGLHFSNRPNR